MLLLSGGLFFSLKYLVESNLQAQTISFLIITFGQMLHVFNVRSKDSGMLVNEVTGNKYIWIAILLSVILTLAILYLQPAAAVMKLVSPGFTEWSVAIAFSTIPLIAGQIFLAAIKHR